MPPEAASALLSNDRVVSLSNQSQGPMCTREGKGFSCGPTTVANLRPSSFVLTWDWCPPELGTGCSPATPGTPITVGGEPAQRWVFTNALDCDLTHGSEVEMRVGGRSPSPNPQYYSVLACIRGPHQARLQDQMGAVLRNVQFR
jgi:hypothetical protein